ncbi:MAG: rRNA adenine N-6-methyltransferase family protein, partial [Candidatus Aminicenantales bacterium]
MVREWRGLVKQETGEPVSPFIGHQRFIKQRKKAMMSSLMQKSRRHALGQHFLTNPGVLRKIIGVIDPKPVDVIVEIGAGKGVLTAALAE